MATMLAFLIEDLRYDRLRAALTILGLAVLVLACYLLNSLAVTLADTSQSSSNLVVVQNNMLDPTDVSLDPAVLQAARDLPPGLVSRISPHILRRLRVGERLIMLRASPLQDWTPIYQLVLSQGRWPEEASATGAPQVAAGVDIARVNDWQLGDLLEIYGQPVELVGLVTAPGFNMAAVWIPLGTAETLLQPHPEPQILYIQPAVGADPASVLDTLQQDERLAGRYTVLYEDSYARQRNQALRDMYALGRLASAVALLGIVLGTYTATHLSLVERSREIGILRATGFSPAVIQAALLLRAVLQGLLATLVGTGLMEAVVIYRKSFEPSFLVNYPLRYELAAGQALAVLLWVAGMSALGAWLAGRQLHRLPVAGLLQEATG